MLLSEEGGEGVVQGGIVGYGFLTVGGGIMADKFVNSLH